MRDTAKSFRDLIVWQKAHRFVQIVFAVTKDLSKFEAYWLRAQILRAAVSVPANIVEGFKRRGKCDKARFMNIAQSSLEECRYYLILIEDLHLAQTSSIQEDAEEISKMIDAYTKRILASKS